MIRPRTSDGALAPLARRTAVLLVRAGILEEGVHLALDVFLRVPIALLDLATKLIEPAVDGHQVVVRELTPLRLDLALQLCPLAFECVLVHDVSPSFSVRV